MTTSFRLPDLGEGVHEAEILALPVTIGQAVTEGDVIMEIETDKAAVEIPSPYTGTVQRDPGKGRRYGRGRRCADNFYHRCGTEPGSDTRHSGANIGSAQQASGEKIRNRENKATPGSGLALHQTTGPGAGSRSVCGYPNRLRRYCHQRRCRKPRPAEDRLAKSGQHIDRNQPAPAAPSPAALPQPPAANLAGFQQMGRSRAAAISLNQTGNGQPDDQLLDADPPCPLPGHCRYYQARSVPAKAQEQRSRLPAAG